MRIDSYRFGVIKISGIEYKTDLIIFPDRIKKNWWRKQGHVLALEDIDDVLEFKPEVLVVGTGVSGLMQIPVFTANVLESEGIDLMAENTRQACKIFNNQILKGINVVGAFHITC